SRARAGWLYAINTFGASLGCALVGFGLPVFVGVTMSYVVVAATSTLAAIIALVVSRNSSAPGSSIALRQPASGARLQSHHPRLLFLAAGGGALGLALEVLWTRLFALVLHNSVYTFTAVALVFLVALALGSALAALLLRRVRGGALAAAALLSAAASTV